MKKRQLGKTDIRISEVGLGTWQISGDVWKKKQKPNISMLLKLL